MNMENIVNMTPHEINIVGEDGEIIATFPPSEKVARVVIEGSPVEGMPSWVTRRSVTFDATATFPPSGGVIVSAQVAVEVAQQRATGNGVAEVDIFTVGETVKNAEGKIIGAKGFVIN